MQAVVVWVRVRVRALQRQAVDILVTGSLHLVGGVIEVANLSDVAL